MITVLQGCLPPFHLLVTSVDYIDLPAQKPVSEALIVDGVRRVPVRSPLEDPGLSFLAEETERPLISTE